MKQAVGRHPTAAAKLIHITTRFRPIGPVEPPAHELSAHPRGPVELQEVSGVIVMWYTKAVGWIVTGPVGEAKPWRLRFSAGHQVGQPPEGSHLLVRPPRRLAQSITIL